MSREKIGEKTYVREKKKGLRKKNIRMIKKTHTRGKKYNHFLFVRA